MRKEFILVSEGIELTLLGARVMGLVHDIRGDVQRLLVKRVVFIVRNNHLSPRSSHDG